MKSRVDCVDATPSKKINLPLQQGDRLNQLLVACQAIDELQNVTLYGNRHREIRFLHILEKFSSTASKSLKRKDLREALDEINAINAATESQLVEISFNSREIQFIRRVLRHKLKVIRRIPLLARQQAIIALSTAFEGFVSDVISDVFDSHPQTLKSGKATLKDDELVEGLQSGEALSMLKAHRLRDVMYGSVEDWYKFMEKYFGITPAYGDGLQEMFVIRNAVVHSKGRVTKELAATGKSRFRRIGRDLNVTDKDLNLYSSVVREAGKQIAGECTQKFHAHQEKRPA